ncbi:hypothetical protein N7453_000651 [Penicillium expansum]|nr:hypothetical protein N7453_000651 [Penicillium expansum]
MQLDSHLTQLISVYNPADGSLVSDQIPIAGEGDVERAIEAAQQAFAPGSEWRRMDDFARQKVLLNFADLIERNQEYLASLTRVTLGAPYKPFGKSEIDTAIGCFRYYAGWVGKFAGQSFPATDGFFKVVRNEPLGVVAGCVNGLINNSGQICFAASRVYVQEGIYDKFLAAYRTAVAAKREVMGDPESLSSEIGPVVDQAQYERILRIINTAKANNDGKLLQGGEALGTKGFYIDPAIFLDTGKDSSIARDEIFGPVVVINRFKTEEEVIALSNASQYGLMAGVFTQDINRGLRLSELFDSGVVGVNCVSTIHFSCPFGGTKESGIGRELGVHALHAYTEPKTVLINLTY